MTALEHVFSPANGLGWTTLDLAAFDAVGVNAVVSGDLVYNDTQAPLMAYAAYRIRARQTPSVWATIRKVEHRRVLGRLLKSGDYDLTEARALADKVAPK